MLCCCRLPLRSANDKDTHLKKAGFASLRGSMLPHIVVTKVSLGVLRHFASRMIRGRVTLILLDVKVVLELYITVCLGVCLLVDFFACWFPQKFTEHDSHDNKGNLQI